MRNIRNHGIVCIALTACVGLISAQEPDGPDFEVAGSAGTLASSAAVAKAPEGRFLVVWKELLAGNGDDHGIFGRLYDADGRPEAGPFLINTYTTGGQESPKVTVDGAGQFTVVWDCNGSGNIRGRQISPDGVPLGSDFVVSSAATNGDRLYPSVAADDDGDFVVVWGDFGVAGDADETIQGRRYNSDGTPISGQFRANIQNTEYSQERPDVAVNPLTGDFLVTWESIEPGFSSDDIRVGRFNSSGVGLGELIVNTYTSGFQQWPSIEVEPNGRFTVAWSGPTSGDTEGITMTRLTDTGSVIVPNTLVNSFTTGRQDVPHVDMRLDGTARVVWQSPGSPVDSDQEGVVAALADPLSAPGSNVQVNTVTAGAQIEPQSDWDHRRRQVVVWQSGDTIRARLFDDADELAAGGSKSARIWGLRGLGNWHDFRVAVPPGIRQMQVIVDNLGPTAPNDVDLFVRRSERPDSTTFDCRSNLGGGAAETCTVDHPAPGLWWVSVANWDQGDLGFDISLSQTVDPGLIFRDGFESGDTTAW